ncbi:MAG: MBL fold metallo-hydrolase [Candidatus Omnitrophica bacterium]|nr:MBL fold metallo-hydrolase [Candidatus Omnitrophota bacterium]
MISDKRDIEIKAFEVGPIGTNCYLTYDGNKTGILIDPGYPETAIRDFILRNDLKIEYTVNTHGHGDHIAGNKFFDYPVYIHELDEPFLTDGAKNLGFFAGMTVPKVKAFKILKDGDKILAGKLEFTVIHTPGHTPGGICLLAGNVLFAGDTLFHEGVGRTDLPGGSQKALEASIKNKLFTLPDNTKVYPGHGPATTIGHEKRNNPYITYNSEL